MTLIDIIILNTKTYYVIYELFEYQKYIASRIDIKNTLYSEKVFNVSNNIGHLQVTVPLRIRKWFDASFDISSIRTKLKNFTARKVENFLRIIVFLWVVNDVFISSYPRFLLFTCSS